MLGLFAHSNFWLAERRSWLLAILPSFLWRFLWTRSPASANGYAKGQKYSSQAAHVLTLYYPKPGYGCVVGVPFLAAFVWLISSTGMYFHDTPDALIKVFSGILITLSGAIGFETLTNLVIPGSIWNTSSVLRGVLRNARRHNRALG
jgi:hypothetical protein